MKVKQVRKVDATTRDEMKTTVPNSTSQGGGGVGVSNSIMGSSTPTSTTTTASGKIKDSTGNKLLLEKELEDVTKQLKGINSNGKNDTSKTNNAIKAAGHELKLWEQKILLMLKLKQWSNVTEEGYKILGKKGPSIAIYKCILVSLCRVGKFEDVVELLEQWKRNAPKCSVMLDTKQKMEGYLTAIRSGVDVNKLLLNIEDVIKVADSGAGAQSLLSGTFLAEPNWKYRPFPQRHNTFSLCPRVASGVTCIYGNECLSAHSKEELKEWQQRILWKNNKAVLSLVASSSEAVPTQQKSSIPKEQIPISYRILPPACMYYLAGLVKRVQETKNLKTLFVDSLSDVKIKLSTASSITKRLGSKPVLNSHKWSCMIASKRPLATVTLLHDQTRDRFAITGAFFFNSKRATLDLVELHPNNKSQKGIQVLNTFIRPELFLPFNNGWPDWCCYQIDVLFQTPSQSPGKFEQDIIFDFKNDPKISKRISVTLEPPIAKIEPVPLLPPPITLSINSKTAVVEANKPKISTSSSSSEEAILGGLERDFRDNILLNIPPRPQLNNITATNNKSNPNSSTSSGGSLSQSLSDCEENLEEDFRSSRNNLNIKPEIMPFCNGHHGEDKDLNSSIKDSQFGEVNSVAGQLVRQWVNGTEASYNQLIEDLEDEHLNKENYASWMNRFLQCEIKAREQELMKLSVKSEINIFNPSNTGFNASLAVGLFGKLFLAKDVNEDSKIGRLINNNCSSISIGEVNSAVISKPRTYACRVINKTEQAIIILIGRQAVEELQLCPGSTRKLDIWLHLDHSYLDLLKAVLQGISEHHLQFLFPIFPPTESQPWDFNSLVNSSIPKYEVDETLNSKQRDALHAILSVNNSTIPAVPVIVTGPPSSGKSHLIARSIQSIFNSHKSGKFQSLNRVLICTYTNKAADEFITDHFSSWLSQSKVDESCLLRIYHADQSTIKASFAVKKHCLMVNDGNSFRYPTLEELLSYKIVIVTVSTCLELLQLGLPDCIFSHIIIDECHRMIEAESLCPILLAGKNTRIIAAGDMKLLNPETFTIPTMASKCQEITLVDRLNDSYPQRHPFRIRLDEVYNINQDIVQFVSNEFYSSSVKCAKSPLDHPTYHPLAFSIVQGGEDCQPDHGDGYYNMKEICEILDRLMEVIRAWPPSWGSYKDHSIVVITPYSDQERFYNYFNALNALFILFGDQAMGLRIKLKLEGLSFVDVEALTNVLSRQYRVVIISPVRTFKKEDPENSKLVRESDAGGGFYINPKAVYTALTRAQNLTIVVGDLVGLCNIGICKDIWRQFVSVCRKNNSVLGLPGTFDTFNSTCGSGVHSGIFQEQNITSITRPNPTFLPQNLKKSDVVSTSSPNLDNPTGNSDSFPSHSSTTDINIATTPDDKSGSLQKLRSLSSIWNTPDPVTCSTPSPPPPQIRPPPTSVDLIFSNKEPGRVYNNASSILSYSNIWGAGDSPSTGSLGNLSDPSSIWGAGSTSSQTPTTTSTRASNGDIFQQGTCSNTPTVTDTGIRNNIFHATPIMPSLNFPTFDGRCNSSSYKSAFDLNDVRLMSNNPVINTSSRNNVNPQNTTTSTCNNPIVGSSISPSPYRPVLHQQQPTSNLPELLRLPNPVANACLTPSPTLSGNSSLTSPPGWPTPPSTSNNISAFGLNSMNTTTCTSQNQTLAATTNNIQQQNQESLINPKGLTSFEIAQANYAYFHGPPRRLGYNPPPRMLRTYRPLGQLTGMEEYDNFNSNLISSTGFAKESPKNFDFFKELDLNSVPVTAVDDRKCSFSSAASSSSQDNSVEIDTEENKSGPKFTLLSSEFPDLGNSTAIGGTGSSATSTTPSPAGAGWIEVKSTKKGGKKESSAQSEQDQQLSQKKKSKKKSLTIEMSTVPFGKAPEKVLSVDQMIESLKEMGFKKRDAIKALQMCNRDLERAVEWLIINN